MYTTNEEGILNNYALEVPVYYAEYPSEQQKSQYAIQAAIATLFVGLLVLTAASIS